MKSQQTYKPNAIRILTPRCAQCTITLKNTNTQRISKETLDTPICLSSAVVSPESTTSLKAPLSLQQLRTERALKRRKSEFYLSNYYAASKISQIETQWSNMKNSTTKQHSAEVPLFGVNCNNDNDTVISLVQTANLLLKTMRQNKVPNNRKRRVPRSNLKSKQLHSVRRKNYTDIINKSS